MDSPEPPAINPHIGISAYDAAIAYVPDPLVVNKMHNQRRTFFRDLFLDAYDLATWLWYHIMLPFPQGYGVMALLLLQYYYQPWTWWQTFTYYMDLLTYRPLDHSASHVLKLTGITIADRMLRIYIRYLGISASELTWFQCTTCILTAAVVTIIFAPFWPCFLGHSRICAVLVLHYILFYRRVLDVFGDCCAKLRHWKRDATIWYWGIRYGAEEHWEPWMRETRWLQMRLNSNLEHMRIWDSEIAWLRREIRFLLLMELPLDLLQQMGFMIGLGVLNRNNW